MFFANSASIKPVLPQASQLRNNIFIRYQFCFTSVRDPIKDTLQRDRERKKAQHPAGTKPTTSRVFAHEECTLPLWTNRWPKGN